MRRIFSFVFLSLCMCSLLGAERSVEEAAVVAAQFTNQQPALRKMHKSARTAGTMKLAATGMKTNTQKPAFYVFNQENNKGYVLVSADDRTEDVLLYAEAGQFDIEKVNPNLKWWLSRLQEEISGVNDENAVDKSLPKRATTAISPLLVNKDGEEITWNQETPYNNLCPMDDYDNTRCLTGCVATATAQVMYKWRYPVKGTGSSSYTWENANTGTKTTLSANYGATTYDWDNMLPAYDGKSYTTAQAKAVATLMYQCGVACKMEYGGDNAGGSGAYTDDMGLGLRNYFGYNVERFITTYTKKNYGTAVMEPAEYSVSISKFQQYFDADLEAGRPIIMGGEDSDGGHEFVCDGRNTNGYYHINWGWEGDGNNYVLLSALKPSRKSYNFSSQLDALIGVEPAIVDTIHVTGVTVSPASLTLNINEKAMLTATVAPANATIKGVTWTSSNTSVVTVSSTGTLRALASGSAVITATTKDGGYQASAMITVTNVVMATNLFELVTTASALKAGDEILLVNQDASVALSTEQKSNNRGQAEVTIKSDNTIEIEDEENTDVQLLTLESGTKSGTWAFNTGAGYLYAASSKSNYLRTEKTLTANSSWTVSVTSGVAVITAQGTNTHNVMRYNKANTLFAAYDSGSKVTGTISIYKRMENATALPSILQNEQKAVKVWHNGQLLIYKGNQIFNLQGQRLQ